MTDWLIGGGQTGDLIRSIDWSVTGMGVRSDWPQSLRTALGMVLSNHFPMAILWGTERVLLYNDACAALVADRNPQAMGQPAHKVWPELAGFNRPLVGQVLTQGEAVYLEDQPLALASDGRGEDGCFTLCYSPIRTENGSVGGVLVTLMESTRGNKAEGQLEKVHETVERPVVDAMAALAQREQHYRLLYETMLQGVVYRDTEGRILSMNPAAERILGRSAAEFLGRTSAGEEPGTRREDGSSLPAAEHPAMVALRTRQQVPATVMGVYNPREKAYRWINASAVPLVQGDEERPNEVYTIFDDITDRIRMEQALATAKNNAEQASQAKDHFLAVLSHELRTPLTPVVATLSMLQEDPQFDAQTRERLEMIRRNVELEARLIDDLLDLTRIARGKIELFLETVALPAVLQRAIEVCMPDIEAHQVRFRADVEAGPLYVRADASRLQQVFWNLLSNAVKFTPMGGRIGLRCHGQGGGVVVEITDNGVGIESEALARLFDGFEQADRTVTTEFAGLGLGLAICKALVTVHGGVISAHSAGKGQGATFRVVLPTVPAPTLHPAADGHATSQKPQKRPLRILLVEDHGDTARVMRQVLQNKGHYVQTAGDVASALMLAGRETFDLVISDLGLPDGNGLDLMRQLKQRHGLKGIALSGFGMEEDIRKSEEAGFLAHLTKPITPQRLEEVIESVSQ